MINFTDLVRGMRDYRFATVPVVMVAIFASSIYAFLQIADEVGENEIEEMDQFLLLLFRSRTDANDPLGPPWLEEAVAEITTLGGYPVLILLVGSVTGFLIVARKYGPALYVLASVILGTVVSQGLKMLYDRPRPDIVDHLVGIHTASFPSGHATMSTVVYLTLAALIIRLVDDARIRVYVMSVAIFVALLVGLSRIYLGVHWPSDVAAGWTLGAAWASLSWLAVSGLRAYRNREMAGS
ncbi:phosphatase PAP2 family protein [Mesorhizobium sp. CAU 1741]|uniref:phosphatase PAP2 family protein n=1 Tax=Mesorhizobium sp. CAU 1741 TaxID=3140366 RepID=UPI00325BBB6C